ncbi:MAG: hypothetical protein H0Z37_02810 [Firmicutes bacterium]|nr:hypothetical protein [Bacillota bacterium]
MPSEKAGWVNRLRDRVLPLPNVVGCGWGEKRTRGRPTGKHGMIVFVKRKVPAQKLKKGERVPAVLGALPTDVVEVGELRLLAVETPVLRTMRLRPAPPGVSVGHLLVSAGTLGAVVKDAATGRTLILSNNHVLANQTDGQDGRAQAGDAVLQPGSYDGGRVPQDIIGRLARFVPIRRCATEPRCSVARAAERVLNAGMRWLVPKYRIRFARLEEADNLVDAAVAEPAAPGIVKPSILDLGPVRGVAEAEVGMRVEKSGRTSGVTRGEVIALGATFTVSLGDSVAARFSDQIVTTPMAQPGDSGSLIVDERRRAVGLLFAGSEQATLCNRIQNVLEQLDIHF